MRSTRTLENAKATAIGMKFMLRTAHNAGFIGLGNNPKAILMALPNILRYHFSFARNLENARLNHPNRIAVIDDRRSISFQDLSAEIQHVSRWLIDYAESHGVKRRDFSYGVLALNSIETIDAAIAKSYNGMSCNMLNVQASKEQLTTLINQNDIRLVFADSELAHKLPSTVEVVILNGPRASESTHPRIVDSISHIFDQTPKSKLPLIPGQSPNVLFSSGTTGTPKGVGRNDPMFPITLGQILSVMAWKPLQTIYMPCTLFHAWGHGGLNIAFAGANTLVIRRIFDPKEGMELIDRYQCEGSISSPIFLKYMLSDDYSLESLKWIGSSGNKVTKDLVERANSRFGRPIVSNLYGSTETDMTTCAPPEVVLRDPSIVGMPSPGIQVLVHDGNGNKVPTGRIGQIAMKSPMMLDEYTNPDKEPPYVPNTGGMINMGDMGFYDSEGYLHVVGRSDSMIIVGGENVHPESVTEVIEKHPHIKEAFAIGVDDPEKFQRIAAIVVTDGSSVTEDDVRDWVDDNLASHSIPRDVYFTDSLPRNAMGKVMINEVKQLIDRMA